MSAPKKGKSLRPLVSGSTMRFCGSVRGAERRNDGAQPPSFRLAKPFAGPGKGSDELDMVASELERDLSGPWDSDARGGKGQSRVMTSQSVA
jgi:hypothetical protein